MLPTFLLIGAEKSGTTSIHNYLRAHPEVFMTRVKEPLFFAFEGQTLSYTGPGHEEFNARPVTALDDYQALFAGSEGYPAAGESSATYLYYPQSPERAAKYVPNAKLIVILRNPADRAYSNYLHGVRARHEHLEFGAALEAEEERRRAGWTPFFSYKEKGWYHAQLSRWMKHFSRDQFIFFLYDDFRAHPMEVMRQIYVFIGVNPEFRPNVEVEYNVSGKPFSPRLHEFIKGNSAVHALARTILSNKTRARIKADVTRWNLNRPALAPQLRSHLLADYAPDIANLGPMIGQDLARWSEKRPSASRIAQGWD